MIDWKKETTKENYCGYCTGYPPSSNCDGSCFKDIGDVENNKIAHAQFMIKKIPREISLLKSKEAEFKDFLNSIKK